MKRSLLIHHLTLFIGIFYLSLTLALSPPATAKPGLSTHPDYSRIMGVLRKNLASIQAKDSAGVMDTLSKSCAAYEATKQILPQLFTISLHFKLLNREVISISAQESVVQETIEVKKDKSKQAFRNNRSVTQSKLIKDSSGDWKLCSTEVKEVIYLDEQHQVDTSNPSSQKVLKTIKDNFQAMVNEDLSRVLTTISKRCESYQATQKTLPKLFASYDLEYKTVERKLVSITQTKARVRESIIVRKKAGALPFKNNRTTTESEIILDDDGIWRVCSTKILGVKYLD